MTFVFTMPKLSPTMLEGMIAKWHKKEGEHIEAGEILIEVTTDKATVEHPSLDGGWVRKILIKEGQMVPINAPLAIVSETKDADISELIEKINAEKTKSDKTAPTDMPETTATTSTQPVYSEPLFIPEPPLTGPIASAREAKLVASPRARRLAQEKKLDLSSVTGSGPHGRIESADLERAKPLGLVQWSPSNAELPGGSFEEIPLTPMRKAVGKRLQEAKSFIPHFYVKQTIRADSLVNARYELENLGLKLTYNDLIIRAVAIALEKHPALNRGYNSKNQTLVQFLTIDIAVAVGFEGGLITPIIRHANTKRLSQIAEEVLELKGRAKQGKLKEHEYKGGSFTISNLGMYGTTEFTAVLNPPQAAILAVGAIEEAACIEEGQVVAGKQLHLTLSCDHRVVDGADAAQFLSTLKKLLENAVGLLI